MAFVDANTLAETRVPRPFERSLKVVMSPETHDDVDGFTLLVSTLAPRGGCTETHSHDSSGELMMVTSGTGKAILFGEEFEVKRGAVIYAPPGAEHRTENAGDEPLEILCVFMPPVPAEYVRGSLEAAHRVEREVTDAGDEK